MIDELLEKYFILEEISFELYGDYYVLNDKFWNSPTERQLREVFKNLQMLGFKMDEPTDHEQDIIDEVIKKLRNR
jgi:hypothetical protein